MDKEKARKQFHALQHITPRPMRLAAESWDEDWKTLISTLLSARTRDETTIPVAENLFQIYPSLKSLSHATIHDIEKIIFKVNFYKTKSKNVVNCAKELMTTFDAKVPHTIEELITLPGVGRKTANVFLSEHGHDTIAVDTHVYQISRYLGWSREKDPHKVEQDLRRLFPKHLWVELNPLLVRFGKTHTKRTEWKQLLQKIKKSK